MDTDRLHRLLRRVRPGAVVHVAEDGTTTPIALAAGRGRWELATAALADLAAARGGHAELRDAAGAVIRTVRLEDDAPDQQVGAPTVGAPTVGAPTVGAPTVAAEQERLLALMLKAQGEALSHQAAMLRPLIDGYQELSASFASYAAQTVELVKLASAAAEAQAQASSAQQDQISQMLSAVATRLGMPT